MNYKEIESLLNVIIGSNENSVSIIMDILSKYDPETVNSMVANAGKSYLISLAESNGLPHSIFLKAPFKSKVFAVKEIKQNSSDKSVKQCKFIAEHIQKLLLSNGVSPLYEVQEE